MHSRHVFRIAPLFTLAILSFPLLGANGGGCGAEYQSQSGDGGSNAWDAGEAGVLPVANGPDKPMTCEWLESNNCWQEIYTAADACAPNGVGSFNDDRSMCSFPDGARLEYAGRASTGGDGGSTLQFVDQRILDPSGALCFSTKTLGWAKGAFTSKIGTAIIEWKSWASYRVICPDGNAYADDVEGTCPDKSTRFRAKKMPNYTHQCFGSSGECTGQVWGADANGSQALVSCK